MKSSCPTIHYIQQVAKAAASLGETSCDTIVGGVRVTVHVPFESAIPRAVLQDLLITARGRFLPGLNQSDSSVPNHQCK